MSKSLKDVLIKNKKSASLSPAAAGKKKNNFNKKSTKPFNKQDNSNKSPNREKGGSKIHSDNGVGGGDRHSKSQSKDKENKSRSEPRSDGTTSGKQQKRSFKPTQQQHHHHKAKRVVVKKPLTPAERKALKPHFKLVSCCCSLLDVMVLLC